MIIHEGQMYVSVSEVGFLIRLIRSALHNKCNLFNRIYDINSIKAEHISLIRKPTTVNIKFWFILVRFLPLVIDHNPGYKS